MSTTKEQEIEKIRRRWVENEAVVAEIRMNWAAEQELERKRQRDLKLEKVQYYQW